MVVFRWFFRGLFCFSSCYLLKQYAFVDHVFAGVRLFLSMFLRCFLVQMCFFWIHFHLRSFLIKA